MNELFYAASLYSFPVVLLKGILGNAGNHLLK